MTLTARQWCFLLVCLAFAAWLRFDFYPDTYYGDEEIPIAVVAQMQKNHSLDTNWKLGIWRKPRDRWAYSYDQYNFSSYNSTLYYFHQLADAVAHGINPAVFNRVTSAVLQLLALTLIYLFTRQLFGAATATSAALFFAVNPLLVVDAHYARPESFLVLVTTLAIALHLVAAQQKKYRLLPVAALLWGIACACKFSLLPMAFVAFIAAFRQRQTTMAFASLPAFLLGAFALAPYLFLRTDITLHGVHALFDQYLGGTSPADMHFTRSDWLLPKYLFVWFGVITWPVMIAALFHPNRWQRSLAATGWLASASYIIFFSLTSFFNESNLSHLAFVWCLLFAFGVDAVRERFALLSSNMAFTALLTLALAMPAMFSARIRAEVFSASAREALDVQATDYEQHLATQCPGTEVVAISPQVLAQIDSGNPPRLIRIDWMKRNEYLSLDEQLRNRNYGRVGEFRFPFHDLPHSQLQSIHYPAAYRYYCLRAER